MWNGRRNYSMPARTSAEWICPQVSVVPGVAPRQVWKFLILDEVSEKAVQRGLTCKILDALLKGA
jgi:hypothetical protein